MSNKHEKKRIANKNKKERQRHRQNKLMAEEYSKSLDPQQPISIWDENTQSYIDVLGTIDDPCPAGHYEEAYKLVKFDIKVKKCNKCGEIPAFYVEEDKPNILIEYRPDPDDRVYAHEINLENVEIY